ncbi:hypothetical protein ACOT81_30695 [Streptomyces sp. WI04-05B]|uniref:hypothetical protein n=1 Tax=Streptomyces TaxID=1883 RepID=UPI0029BA9EB2|nr:MULTISPECIES: hypothetical protein [unclassified Streptomyces]MDX2542339.1 hypothetical protein [Streptomyces sp. WI04-05B]MDX2584171.1 hypothetical protein [Streptomyces sp. WI04-05A]
MTWTIERAPGRPVRRTDDDRIAVPLRLNRTGSGHPTDPDADTDTDMALTLAEAEHLHAALCRALDGQPPPPAAPDCRRSVQTSPGTAHLGGRA